MTRSLKVYNGEDQTPITDITDMVEWPDSEFGQRAHLGESTLSTLRFRDEDGRVGNSDGLPAGLTALALNAHNVVIWEESGATMGRFRISPKDWTRGEQVAGRAREAQVTLEDYNADLRNIVVHGYERPAETDVARVQGVLATYLSGSPRRTTNFNGSNLVSGSNTVNLPATTYNRTNTAEVLASIAATANKQYFVTIDAQLFYDGNDSTAYSCPFQISDRDTDLSSTVFAPQPGGFGPASSEDGQQLLSGIWLFYGDTQYVHVANPVVANQFSWWEDVIYDDTVTTSAAATVLAKAILAQRQTEERQIAVKIGPLTYGQAIQIKTGQLIQIKWRAIPDADDDYVSRRITELRWTTPEPFSFFADMILDRPIRLHGSGQKIDTVIPKSAPEPIPDTVGSAIATWDFNTAVYPDLDNETGLIAAFLTLSTGPNCPGGGQCAYNTASHRNTEDIAVTAGTDYSFTAELQYKYDPSVRDITVRWYSLGSQIGETMLVAGAGHSKGTDYTETATVTAITGATSAQIWFSPYAGIFVDNMSWNTVGTVTADDPFAILDSGTSPYYARSDDPRFTNDDQHLTSRITQRVTNNSGATLAAGDVVVPDITIDGPAITRTTTASSTAGPIGVILEGAAAAAEVVVLWSGAIPFVNTNGTPADGDYLFTSTTAGAANRSATRAVGAFGRIVRDDGDGETLSCLIWGVPDPVSGAAANLPWFIVTDYGATGDGTTDDTAAINSAIAALNTAGAGILYFPGTANSYLVSAGLTAITANAIVMGDGMGASTITCSSATANLFTSNSASIGVGFRDLTLANSATATAGAAIRTTGSGNMARYHNLRITGFWVGIRSEAGAAWVMDHISTNAIRKYGIHISNAVSPDTGIWCIDNCTIQSDSYGAADAAVRIDSSGGGKITNLETSIGFVHGIDVAMTSGDTVILLVSNCAIEGVTGDGIHITQTGTSTWKHLIIDGCQFGLWNNNTGKAISIVGATAGALSEIVISDNVLFTNGTARSAIQLTNVDNVSLSGNVLDGFNALYTATTSTNIVEITAGVTDHGALTGLADDDHTQYTRKATLTTTGDLYYASSTSTPARLAIGATDQVLTVAGGVPAWAAAGGGIGEILIVDSGASTPIIFADLIQNEAQTDLVYADP